MLETEKIEDVFGMRFFFYSQKLNTICSCIFIRMLSSSGVDIRMGLFMPHLQLQTRAESLSIRGQTFELNETMIMAVDIFEGAAKNDFDSAVQILSRRDGGPYVLLKEHTDAWASTWARGNIEVHSTTLFNFYDGYIFFK